MVPDFSDSLGRNASDCRVNFPTGDGGMHLFQNHYVIRRNQFYGTLERRKIQSDGQVADRGCCVSQQPI